MGRILSISTSFQWTCAFEICGVHELEVSLNTTILHVPKDVYGIDFQSLICDKLGIFI